MELNFDGLEMQKWNIPMDIVQSVDEKNGSFDYLSCLLSELSSLKCQKWLFAFCANESKKSVTVWAIYLSASHRSYLAISKWVLSYH